MTTDHDGQTLQECWLRELSDIITKRNMLRAALVGLVGVDGIAELEQLEAAMRLMPAPAEDKIATIDAIHALIATHVGRMNV